MNLSNDTIDELFNTIENEYTNANLQRLLLRFEIKGWQNEVSSPKMIAKAIPDVASNLNGTEQMGRFVSHVLANIREKKEKYRSSYSSEPISPLSDSYPKLYNSLLRDGYKVSDYNLAKVAPEVMEEKKIPDELIANLDELKLLVAKGHLDQAKTNYREGNWAAANGMTRSFIESILIHINNELNPSNPATGGGDAINKLSASGFFREDLNEIDKKKQPYGFIAGFWKMLHPHGPHPGLSVEEDSTF